MLNKGVITAINGNKALRIEMNDFGLTYEEAEAKFGAIIGTPIGDAIMAGISEINSQKFTIPTNLFYPDLRKKVEGEKEEIFFFFLNGSKIIGSVDAIGSGWKDGVETVFTTNQDLYDWLEQFVGI